MDRRQAALLIRGCDLVAGYFRAGVDEAQAALASFQPEIGEAAEACSYFAASVANIAVLSSRSADDVPRPLRPGEFIRSIPVESSIILPNLGFNWNAGVNMVALVADGATVNAIQAAGSSMDVPTAINSCFAVAASAIRVHAGLTNKGVSEWITIIRRGAQRET